MMGRRNQGQGQLFYEFHLDEAVPDDHLVRSIATFLDLSWVYAELAPYYSEIGRPSIDPVLMIRMLIIGYVFAIRSERQICREAFEPIEFTRRSHMSAASATVMLALSGVCVPCATSCRVSTSQASASFLVAKVF